VCTKILKILITNVVRRKVTSVGKVKSAPKNNGDKYATINSETVTQFAVLGKIIRWYK
tara:strand:- start:218 stop:391 length:174 start_codon:yes stop_codon:yes gene_type:complete